MAETHPEAVEVRLAPGCIVCDACETDCPEVFDVQEETCVIRPEAQNAEFTKPLTPSIMVAAEGCPVDVIKFETVEVEGPEPWAGQEQEAGAGAAAGGGGGGGAAKKAGWQPPTGRPDPKWAGLLTTSYTSGSRSAGGPHPRRPLPAKAPAEAVASVIPASAPPDAVNAAMLGSGYAAPQPSVEQRVRTRAGLTRREFGAVAGISAAAATGATFLGAFQDFFVPKLTKEPPSTFRAGKLSDYSDDGVYEQFKQSQNVWLVRNGSVIYALSTICTHLGCIPNWLLADEKFKCPCHGSGFYRSGVNFEGPAPRPLERHAIRLDGETVIVDKGLIFRQELGQWSDPRSFVEV